MGSERKVRKESHLISRSWLGRWRELEIHPSLALKPGSGRHGAGKALPELCSWKRCPKAKGWATLTVSRQAEEEGRREKLSGNH